MVENLKNNLKKSFSNGPKAKIMLGLIICLFCVTSVIISMRKTVNVSIDGNQETFVTYKQNVKDVLQEQGYSINEKDKVQPSLEAKISKDQTIAVKKAVLVNIVIAGTGREILTAEDTIGDMLVQEAEILEAEGVQYKAEDIVTPSRETVISEDMNIQLVNVLEEEVTDLEAIPYETEQSVDYGQLDTYREVTKLGVSGEKEVTYKVLKHDDQIVAKVKVGEKPITAPENESVIVGGSTLKVNRSGESYQSKKTMYMESTAYSGGGITATGRRVAYNPGGLSVIAVDPRVIPLGSLVEVAGYGRAIAADTGGAIKGNIIDVYFDSSSVCSSWGRKYDVEVNVIAYPGEW
ncbi:G5 and 3D domain-containing protein [Clostridium vincentii]|uniref:Cell wall-binding protein YocH n=1 Tax=Clostridium vincentii TaxID=52704 RepID=A0A2T0BHD5_9CLOT|nr:G5 and 3D domain-containing protein [Clostridium vincentii]PRR83294.1 Cell wall-binding protein YocH precursor [Clostridium vincentii]